MRIVDGLEAGRRLVTKRTPLDEVEVPEALRTRDRALFGEGLASYYYSEGLGRRIPETEIVLLDHLRYFGFVVTPVVWLALLFPTLRLSTQLMEPTRLMSSAIFVLYLAQTFTNPVLFNSYGLTIVLWYWWRLLRESPRDPTAA